METTRKRPSRRSTLKSNPEEDPLWGLFGVWGRVLIVFANIGFLLSLGASLLGWGMFKFILHVFGVGLLLLFARPNYSPFLSSSYCETGMTREEIDELKRMVLRKIRGQNSSYQAQTSSTTAEVNVVRTIARQLPTRSSPQLGIRGSLGWFGNFLRRVINPR